MSFTRTTTLTALALAALIAPTAHAATKKKPVVPPVCNLITDEKGDTFALRSQDGNAPGPQEDGLDIVSMDVASNATTLTGVIRVVKLANTVSSAPNGIDFRIGFTLPSQDPDAENFFLNARMSSAGEPSFLLGKRTVVAQGQSTTAKLADGTGVFDLAKSEVRLSVPLSAVTSGSETLKSGMKISFLGLDQTSARQVVVNPATGVGTATFADVAASEKLYTAGAKSCVTPGK